MLKSIQSCAAHVYLKTSHTEDYHVYKIYTITESIVSLSYMITCPTCITCIIIIIYLILHAYCIRYMYIVHFSSCGAILSLTADHLPS